MDDNNVQNSLCITSMKQELSGPTEAHGPFILYAGNIVKCPFTYSYWLNGTWFLQIVDIGNFIRRLEILKSAPSLTG